MMKTTIVTFAKITNYGESLSHIVGTRKLGPFRIVWSGNVSGPDANTFKSVLSLALTNDGKGIKNNCLIAELNCKTKPIIYLVEKEVQIDKLKETCRATRHHLK